MSSPEHLRAVPSISEQFRAVPSSSEQFRAVPSSSEQFRAVPNGTEQLVQRLDTAGEVGYEGKSGRELGMRGQGRGTRLRAECRGVDLPLKSHQYFLVKCSPDLFFNATLIIVICPCVGFRETKRWEDVKIPT